MKQTIDKQFWDNKYTNEQTGWDIGYVSSPIKEYIDQLTNKELRILIPGAGNSYEAEYLYKQGFKNVTVIDISKQPLLNISKRIPEFPSENLLHQDFFKLNGEYDIIFEQTFFCALDPSLRKDYVNKMHEVLSENGKLVGLMFDAPLNTEHPPFGGTKEEYKNLFEQKFEMKIIEMAHNSIESRAGKEVFINFIKK
ncbi:TPMT family class I SAM-dependent methyltransferase [bacterium]|nr:TPMT family class I SAM-dependent methyltransferase [bacterium]MDB4088178.1 TPMT family class I SAM-dependent methyltransferase [Flavobacteriales bacterium]